MPCPFGRQLVQTVPAERHRDRLDPFRAMVAEVLIGEKAAKLPDPGRDPPAQLAAVEDPDPLLGDEAEAGGQVGVPNPLPGLRGALAVDQVGRSPALVFLDRPGVVGPIGGDHGGDRKPFLGERDRWRQRLGQGQRPEPGQEIVPGGEGAGHGDRFGALVRHGAVTLAHQRLAGGQRPRAAAPVQADEPFLAGRPEEREGVAARAGHHRLHDVEDRGGGHRRVDRVAAPLQHREAGGGGERLTRGDGAVRRVDRRAAGHGPGLRSLGLGRPNTAQEHGTSQREEDEPPGNLHGTSRIVWRRCG